MVHDLQSQSKSDQPKYKSIATERSEPTTSVTSYCLDTGGLPQNFSIPNLCLEGDIDSLAPDALLSRGFDSQNMMSELSGAAISPDSFGMPDMSFKPDCSNDVTDSGVLGNNGVWGNNNQSQQRMRTYTKVINQSINQ